MKSEHDSNMAMSDRILDTIEKQGITPKPKWHFLLREWVVWSVALLALVLGSIASALTIYIVNATRFVEQEIHFSDLNTLFHLFPVLWLVLLGLGIFYTVYALHTTRRGYRWHSSWLVSAALLVSILVGWTAHAAGLGASIDRYLIAEVPLYKPLTGFEPMHWMNPNVGIVAGVIESVGEEEFIIRSLDGELFEITTTATTTMHDLMEIKEGVPVRVAGTTTDEEVFEASHVAPFRGRGGGKGRGPRNADMHSGDENPDMTQEKPRRESAQGVGKQGRVE